MDENEELDIYSDYNRSLKLSDTTIVPKSSGSGFFSSFFGTGGFGNNILNYAGSIGINLLSNRGKQIEGEYKTELQKLANEGNLSKAEFETKLAAINAARATQLEELSNERTKSSLIIIGVVVLGLGLLITLAVVALKKKK